MISDYIMWKETFCRLSTFCWGYWHLGIWKALFRTCDWLVETWRTLRKRTRSLAENIMNIIFNFCRSILQTGPEYLSTLLLLSLRQSIQSFFPHWSEDRERSEERLSSGSTFLAFGVLPLYHHPLSVDPSHPSQITPHRRKYTCARQVQRWITVEKHRTRISKQHLQVILNWNNVFLWACSTFTDNRKSFNNWALNCTFFFSFKGIYSPDLGG